MKTLAFCLALFAISVRADEFRAVVVADSESAALRSAKARAVEAEAAFAKLREATEAKYKSRFRGCCVFDWSDDYRVIVEPKWAAPSNQWLQPQPLYQPGGWGSVTIPTTNGRLTWLSGEPFSANAVPMRDPLGSVLTLNDGEIHGAFGGTVRPGEVLGSVK